MTDLTDRMLTCAAFLLGQTEKLRAGDLADLDHAVRDAVDLLIEASKALGVADKLLSDPKGEPMDVIPPSIVKRIQDEFPAPPPQPVIDEVRRTPNACPRCDSRTAKKVRRDGRKLMLICPVCTNEWEYKTLAEWR